MIEFQTTWGWQVALYLFLGGIGAGTYVAASILYFVRGKRHRKTIVVSYWASSACLGVGLFLLLTEIEVPYRAFRLWESFSNESSWMALGAWGAVSALFIFVCSAFLACRTTADLVERIWPTFPDIRHQLRSVLALLGSVLACFVAFYTGMLLKSSTGIPFWNSWLLPFLFTTSALGAGINAVTIIATITKSSRRVSRRGRRFLAFLNIAIVGIETMLIVLYFNQMLGGEGMAPAQSIASAASAGTLLFGDLSMAFWLFVVVCGLALPLVLSISSCFLLGKPARLSLVLGATSALVGDCALRFVFLYAGAHTDFVGLFLTPF